MSDLVGPRLPPGSLDPVPGSPSRPVRGRRTQKPSRRGIAARLRGRVARAVRTPGEARTGVRIALLGLALACMIAAMLARLWYLQVLGAPSFQQAVSANTLRTVTEAPVRGLIYDRDGKLLVGNEPIEVVTVDRAKAAHDPAMLERLATLLGTTTAALRIDLENPNYSVYKPVHVAVDVAPEVYEYLSEHADEFPGVAVDETTERSYPYGGQDLATQLLGHVGDITASELGERRYHGYGADAVVGQDGVEDSYEPYLQGRAGATTYVVNARGEVKGTFGVARPAVAGDNLVLSLDAGIQSELDSALAHQIAALQGTVDPTTGRILHPGTGAAVVLDPTNGDVLAMSSYPGYDPSLWVGGISRANYRKLSDPANGEPLLNRAIDGLYTPGSTFKLATATAALDDGLISPYTTIDDKGTFTIPNCQASAQCVFHNDGGESLGPIDVTTAITASDDVFFYTLGVDFWLDQSRYGKQPIQDVAAQYGLGQRTGIALPDEATGRVDSPAVRLALHQEAPKGFPYWQWYTGDNLEMAFGQGGTVITPLQLATAYATFANGGTRYVPQVVTAITDPSGNVVRQPPPVVAAHVDLPPAVHQAMLQGFIGAANAKNGTVGAYGLFNGFPADFTVAGKTGTADTGTSREPVSLFVAFAPADHPRYVIAVVIDEAGYGATAAAPVAAQVLSYLSTHPVGPPLIPHGATPEGIAPQGSVPPVSSTTAPSTAPSSVPASTSPSAAPPASPAAFVPHAAVPSAGTGRPGGGVAGADGVIAVSDMAPRAPDTG